MSESASEKVQAHGEFSRLEWRRRGRRVPFVQQTAATDCGAACLAMTLGFHGRRVTLAEVRKVTGLGRDGTDAMDLVETARSFGLRGRCLSVEIDSLHYVGPGTILFWRFCHFVVLERIGPKYVEIVDPAAGRRRVPMAEFGRSFTGIAIEFEPAADFERGASRPTSFWPYVRVILRERSVLGQIALVSLLLQILTLGLPLITGMLVDRVIPRSDFTLLTLVSISALVLVIFSGLGQLVRSLLLIQLRTQLDSRMTLGFLEHLVSLPYPFFQMRRAGDLIMRLNSNAAIRELLATGTLSALLDGALIGINVLLLLVASPGMAWMVFALGSLQLVILLSTRRQQRVLMTENLEVQASLQSFETEMLTGMETLKSLGAEQRSVSRWTQLFVDTLNVSIKRGRLESLYGALNGGFQIAAPLAVLVLGGSLVMSGKLTLGTMLALNALGMGALMPLSRLSHALFQLQMLGGYFERQNDVLETSPEQDPKAVRLVGRLKGEITLERVSFRYSPSAPDVVREVSLRILPGEVVAVVGRSGSGKSTLAKLLLGLYQPTSGRVLVDGTDIRELDVRSVRSQLGIVTQDTHLFSGSIRENIALGHPNASLQRIIEAAKLAAVHSDISAMPMGYQTVLMDRGLSLSGGQRQRIALARALVHAPAILLLDEATSALDSVSESRIKDTLTALECTQIIIAHRLSTVARSDRIVVMHEGAVVEMGAHEELLAKKGAYHQLVLAQLQSDVKVSAA
jgi:ATP-binding cassette, subfamily B, bacterial